MSKTGAELLIESLISAGIKDLFTLSGNQILSLYDASIGRDIDLIHTRHEAAAVHMADGWGTLDRTAGRRAADRGPRSLQRNLRPLWRIDGGVADGTIKWSRSSRPNRQRRISGDRPSRRRQAGNKSSMAGRRPQPSGRSDYYCPLSSLRRASRSRFT